MSSTLEDGFEAGGALAIALFFLLVFPAIRDASSLTAAINTFERFAVALVYSVAPSNELAMMVDAVVSVVGGSMAASGFEFDIRVFVVVAGFLWIATNLVMNWFFPPI
ncbi:hypothetical protein [Halobellus litoreus]|uniref:Uncharacterized protein n=1 Tax=Halobellus litoreus TaxID=755310 RepID=A0ABD6DZA6_9EURY|nr:hypothetical protein [Halobellus litoreus]